MDSKIERFYSVYGLPNSAGIETPKQNLTVEGLFKGLEHACSPSAGWSYNIDNLLVPPQPVNGVPWGSNTIWGYLDRAQQHLLRNAIYVKLGATHPNYFINATPAAAGVNDGGHVGPFLNLPGVHLNTMGEVDQAMLSNAITECIIGYRVYRGIKRSRYRKEVYDEEDTDLLRRLAYLKVLLSGKEPNANMPTPQALARLNAIILALQASTKRLLQQEVHYNPSALHVDPYYWTNKHQMYNLLGDLRNGTDTISVAIHKIHDFKRLRICDVMFVIADSIKLISKQQGVIATDDIEGVKVGISLIGKLFERMDFLIRTELYSTDREVDIATRKKMMSGLALLSRRVYGSLAGSLKNMLLNAAEAYESGKNSQSEILGDPQLYVSRYNEIVDCANVTRDKIIQTEKKCMDYGIQPINNRSCDAMTKIAAVVGNMANVQH